MWWLLRDEELHDRVLKLTQKIDLLTERIKEMSAALDALKVQVERNTQVDQSAITLIQGIAQQLQELKDDPAAIEALSNELQASADALSAAVSANT